MYIELQLLIPGVRSSILHAQIKPHRTAPAVAFTRCLPNDVGNVFQHEFKLPKIVVSIIQPAIVLLTTPDLLQPGNELEHYKRDGQQSPSAPGSAGRCCDGDSRRALVVGTHRQGSDAVNTCYGMVIKMQRL